MKESAETAWDLSPMMRSPPTGAALAALLLVTLCAGCSMPASPTSPLTPGGANALRSTGSWMAPDAGSKALLYVSDFQNDVVDAFSYPNGNFTGTLTGFAGPFGECTDAAGDVFVTNAKPPEILEFAHGGTTPIATLKDPGQYPYSCSVDPTTGNLAVTNEYARNSTPGSVAIYRHARSTPKLYYDSAFYYMFFCGYDSAGNLFVDGEPKPSGGFSFAELPSGHTAMRDITLNVAIAFPGGVQWDGKHIAVGDQIGSTIHRFTFSGKNGTEVGSTQLLNAKQIVQFGKQGAYVAGPDAIYYRVGIWSYPGGGNPIRFLNYSFGLPVAATVSKVSTP